MTKRH